MGGGGMGGPPGASRSFNPNPYLNPEPDPDPSPDLNPNPDPDPNQVTLWRHVELAGAGKVTGVVARDGAASVRGAHTHELHNTIDAYAKLDLRNQVGQSP